MIKPKIREYYKKKGITIPLIIEVTRDIIWLAEGSWFIHPNLPNPYIPKIWTSEELIFINKLTRLGKL